MKVETWYKQIEYLLHLNREERDKLCQIITFANCSKLMTDDLEDFGRELRGLLNEH